MILLTSTADQLQLNIPVVTAIDVHVTWVDTILASGTITPGRTNTAITTAGVISVAGSPAPSTQRNVKTLHVRNKHATLGTDITVRHSDGTNTCELFSDFFRPGEGLEYTDQGGFVRV